MAGRRSNWHLPASIASGKKVSKEELDDLEFKWKRKFKMQSSSLEASPEPAPEELFTHVYADN
jgi:TPP-dependent pyruvate/acetoin dehydrogenase alpha subunit